MSKRGLSNHLMRFVEVGDFDHLPGNNVPANLCCRGNVAQIIHLERQAYQIRIAGTHSREEIQSLSGGVQGGPVEQ